MTLISSLAQEFVNGEGKVRVKVLNFEVAKIIHKAKRLANHLPNFFVCKSFLLFELIKTLVKFHWLLPEG